MSNTIDKCFYEDVGANEKKSNEVVDSLASEVKNKNAESLGCVVAAHYNTLEEKGVQERFNSPIFYLRNFNNWIKSMLINEFIDKVKSSKSYGAPLRVLDMCCGKGGDLLKWRKASISHLICADIASVSVEQCEMRYKDMSKRGQSIFSAEFISADCTKERLREKYKDASVELDLVSCQFGFHYSFESLPLAECMLRNAAECLVAGGYFIGTLPDAFHIISQCSKASGDLFGNNIMKVKLEFDPITDGYPLFGGKYSFHLEGVVDCPEFLVHFPTFVKLARKFGLELVYKARFEEYFERMRKDGSSLLGRMKCLEAFPPGPGASLISEEGDYLHAKQFIKALENKDDRTKVGTMSKPEWEAASVYTVFAFKKLKATWNSEGYAVYDNGAD